VKFNLE